MSSKSNFTPGAINQKLLWILPFFKGTARSRLAPGAG